MRELGVASIVIAGAVGEPGSRTFLIQVNHDAGQEWFVLEKGQVAALALRINELLEEHGFQAASTTLTAVLEDPDEVTFRVGDIYLSYEEDSGLFTIVLRELEGEGAVAFEAAPAQMDAMAREGAEAVSAGRPICPRCGLAMDPDGHPCPTHNGNLRGHRP